MTKPTLAGGAVAAVLVLLALAAGYRALDRDTDSAAVASPATASAGEVHPSFLYGRVTTLGGATYEGRLRFGGDEESFWGDYFNGVRTKNPWIAHVPPERLPKERPGIEIFGIRVRGEERQADLGRPFMVRFGDIARIETHGTDARVILKSGAAADINRFDASDFDDGVRVWDPKRGAVNVDSKFVRTIEFLSPTGSAAAPYRLHGTVKTRPGDFTGFIQWDREEGLGSDELDGRTADGEQSVRFDTIRSIERQTRRSSRVTLADGRQIVLSDTREVGEGNRGMYVDDSRYGRVLISWDAFERVDFTPKGAGPAYGDFPPGGPLRGSVTTRDGRRLAGRLVYDLDESEITETLDAPSGGVDYTIPFGLVATVALPGDADGSALATVTLHSGEELQLRRQGDLGNRNAGMLIFVDGQERPAYVPWSEVGQIDFDRPPVMYPPRGGE